MNFYSVPESADTRNPRLQQADLLFPVPFIGFSLRQVYLNLPNRPEFEVIDLTARDPFTQAIRTIPEDSQILANIKSDVGMVVNQTCDLSEASGRQKPIVIARVTPCGSKIKTYGEKTTKEITNHVKILANPGRTPTLFYLPAHRTDGFQLPRSVADLLEVVCLSPEDLGALAELVQLRLTASALQALQERLAYCYGRFGAPDDLYFSEEEWQYLIDEQTAKEQKAAGQS